MPINTAQNRELKPGWTKIRSAPTVIATKNAQAENALKTTENAPTVSAPNEKTNVPTAGAPKSLRAEESTEEVGLSLCPAPVKAINCKTEDTTAVNQTAEQSKSPAAICRRAFLNFRTNSYYI